MPPRIPKACRERGCRRTSIHPHGYCDAHESLASWGKFQRERGANPYNTGKWRKIRKAILERDFGFCQECKRNGIAKAGTDCDHIIPVSQGGDMYRYSNLEILCRTCHQKKTARQ